MQTRILGKSALEVSALGLGCMGMTPIYARPDPAEAQATIRAAVDAGITLIDTADAYAGGRNESLVGAAIAGLRERVVVATKLGNLRLADGTRTVNGRPEYLAAACERSLQRLDTECIDLLFLHRVDPQVPIEDSVGALARLVEQGKARHLGLSEAGAGTIRRAQAVHPLCAVQTEYSLVSRDVERDILPTCRELGIGFVAYAPLGRGLLTGSIRSYDDLAADDRRRDMPRFQPGNLEPNLATVERLWALAAARGVSTAALALAWVLAQGEDVVPIPGCARRPSLRDCLSALDIALSEDARAAISAAVDAGRIRGTRYPAKQMPRLGI